MKISDELRDHLRELRKYLGDPGSLESLLASAERIIDDRNIPGSVAIRECASKLAALVAEWRDRTWAARHTWSE